MPTPSRPRLFLNEDCNHFIYSRRLDQLTPEGVDSLVDGYARGTMVTDLVFNPNASRSAIPSRIKQTMWDGFDPAAGDDQPFFAGTQENREIVRRCSLGFLEVQRRGIDPYRRWIDRSRQLGTRAWLSIRMNDIHNVNEVGHAMHDRFWKEHPEYWRVGWREFEWPGDRSLDYAHPAVRDHHVAYAKECIARYDFDGLEIDWMRQPWCFAPGREEEGLAITLGVMEELRHALDARQKELGHPIQMLARVPARPESARRFGFDPVTWARRGLINVLCPSPDFGTTEYDMPIEVWRQLLEGTGVALTPGLEITLVPFPFAPFSLHTAETARGAAAGLLARGADGIYLFNFMDAAENHPLGVDGLRTLLGELGDLDALAGKPRRHVMTFPSPRYAGEPCNAALPYVLGKYGYRPSAEFRLPTGPAPRAGQAVHVRLGLEANPQEGPGNRGTTVTAFGRQLRHGAGPVDPQVARTLIVHINGTLCPFAGEVAPTEAPAPAGPTHAYLVPPGTTGRGERVIEIKNAQETPALLVWVEVAIGNL